MGSVTIDLLVGGSLFCVPSVVQTTGIRSWSMTLFPSAVRQTNSGSHENGVGGGHCRGRAAVSLPLIPSGMTRAFSATHGVWLPRSNASKHEKYEALSAGNAGGVLGGHNAMKFGAAMERPREGCV